MNHIKKTNLYPSISEFINSGGSLNIGYEYGIEVVACATDEGGVVWEGKIEYDSFDSLLEDAEKGISVWIKENW